MCRHLVSIVAVVLFLGWSSASFAQDSYTLHKRSGRVKSGAKANWSAWYVLAADRPKEGFVLSQTQFRLEGDRQCGAWAECERIQEGPTGSQWRFKLQGHSEDFPGDGVRESEGVLTATYERKPLPDRFTVTKQSDAMWSGRGDTFSCLPNHLKDVAGPSACAIAADAPRSGYRITSVKFRLDGDRQCSGSDAQPNGSGNWARCKQVKRSDAEAIWQFDMQGHSESSEVVSTPNGGFSVQKKAAQSWGILEVTYVRVS